MIHRFAFLLIVITLLARPASAQAPRPDPAGTWRGTSLCLVRPSACHDEVVVYRITRTASPDTLRLDARKIVNGAEEEMGVLACGLDSVAARLSCPLRGGLWLFTVRGDSLVGELRLPNGTKFRDVRTASSSPGVGSGPASGQRTPVPADSLVLERTLCYGTCPAYRLSITAAGRVFFVSRNPGDSSRTAADTVSPAVLRDLVARATVIGFDELPDRIDGSRTLCQDVATDHPTATLTIFRGSAQKRVVDYLGCYARSDHSVVSIVGSLRAFESAVDSAVGSARWVRLARERR